MPIYISKLVLEWLKNDIGGLEEMEERNVRKRRSLLYDFLDRSTLFKGLCRARTDRSIMNVTFVTGDEDLDAKFVKESRRRRLREPEGPPQRGRYARLPSTTPCLWRAL